MQDLTKVDQNHQIGNVQNLYKYSILNFAIPIQDIWLTMRSTAFCLGATKGEKNFKLPYNILIRGQKYFNIVLVLQDEYFGKNYSSFQDFSHNYERTSGIFVP